MSRQESNKEDKRDAQAFWDKYEPLAHDASPEVRLEIKQAFWTMNDRAKTYLNDLFEEESDLDKIIWEYY